VVEIKSEIVGEWLRLMGCVPRRIVGPGTNFQIEFSYPPDSPHLMTVVNATIRPHALVVITQTVISPEHVAAFQELETDEKVSFLRDLQKTLLRDYIEFNLMGIDEISGLVCPSAFQISATRYGDGLSLDSFARTVSSVYKAELAAITCVQEHLGPRGLGGSGNFEFKRIGGIQ
jgi:hypothetical protein